MYIQQVLYDILQWNVGLNHCGRILYYEITTYTVVTITNRHNKMNTNASRLLCCLNGMVKSTYKGSHKYLLNLNCVG